MKLHKKVLIAALPSIIVVALLATGFFVGRYYLAQSAEERIQKSGSVNVFEDMLDDDERKAMVHVYHDAENVLPVIGNFSWAVPNMPTPFVGTAPTPGQHGNAYINSEQFRYEKEIELPKPENTYRIFLAGGSTAYGSGAPSQDRTIAGYLERILAAQMSPQTGLTYEVVNTANPAWASTHERILIENKLSELEPDMVISFSGNNDVHWGMRGKNILWFRTYGDEYYLGLIKDMYKNAGRPDFPEITATGEDEVAPELVASRLQKNVILSSFVLARESADYVFVLQPTMAVTGKQLTEREQGKLKERTVEYFRKSYERMAVRSWRG